MVVDQLFGSVESKMRIRINARPPEGEFAGFSVARFRVGEVYDVGPQLATLLIVSGYAEPVGGTQRPLDSHPG